MADTYAESAYIAEYPAFLSRVTIAMVRAAIDVGAEAFDGTERARLRRALAINVLQEPAGWSEPFAWAVAANPVVTTDTTDSDLSWTVASIWDAMAGAAPAEQPTA